MHHMHSGRRRGGQWPARRGGVARASRFHVQSPDKDAARISVHACASQGSGRWREIAMEIAGDSGVQSDGSCRWAWWRAAAVAGVCLGRRGTGVGYLVGQVAPIEVGPSIVVGMHLWPRVRVGQGWGVRLRAGRPHWRQPHGTAQHSTASKHGSARLGTARLGTTGLRRGAPARARACCSPRSASWWPTADIGRRAARRAHSLLRPPSRRGSGHSAPCCRWQRPA